MSIRWQLWTQGVLAVWVFTLAACDQRAPAGVDGAVSAVSEQDAGAAPHCTDASPACPDGGAGLGACSDCDASRPPQTPRLARAALSWEAIPVEGALCRDGEPALFRVNENPASDKLAIYLEQGGACLADACLTFHVDSPPVEGVFDRAATNNPFGDWNQVYVPYCTGDLHAGDRRDLEIDGAPQQFVGYRNLGLFLERIVPAFRGVRQVVLMGSSAGGFGTLFNYPRVHDAFAPIAVAFLDDSGPLSGDSVISACMQRRMLQSWALDTTILPLCAGDCPDPDHWALDWLRHLVRTYPDARGGVYSSDDDASNRLFFGVGLAQCAEPKSGAQLPADVFARGLREIRSVLSDASNMGSYFARGDQHMCFNSRCFYGAGAEDVPVADWAAGIVAGDARHIGLAP